MLYYNILKIRSISYIFAANTEIMKKYYSWNDVLISLFPLILKGEYTTALFPLFSIGKFH